MSNIVNIILPNYNKGNYLEETVESVIKQTLTDWKLFIIDNYSNDNSKEIIKKYSSNKKISIFLLRRNMGVSFSRNLGIRLSNSKYVSFIDSDDLWKKNKLEKQINFMEGKKIDFTYTDYTPFFDVNNKRYFKKEIIAPETFNFQKFIHNTSICTSSMIVLRELVHSIKFPKVKTLEDFPFKCKILMKSSATKFNENNTLYRITKNSLTSNKFKNLYTLFYINKKFNKLKFLENLKSVFSISIQSLKKYGYK
tara:strand:+ start:131 stop:886 length:756 start_codon:yes stop_codon:yes gene_type:complete